ncbi:hypothetical protein TNCV_3787701 [Trichonephila clavipes]|nr:hypothetical protein TNCV_3787701 [Trichonephila clavipes]
MLFLRVDGATTAAFFLCQDHQCGRQNPRPMVSGACNIPIAKSDHPCLNAVTGLCRYHHCSTPSTQNDLYVLNLDCPASRKAVIPKWSRSRARSRRVMNSESQV